MVVSSFLEDPVPGASSWPDLARARYLSLTTFRRSGDPVPTPIWAARDGEVLYVVTDATSGKVKRIRHTGRVELAPCSMRGKVSSGTLPRAATARIVDDGAEAQRADAVLRRKYRIGMPLVSFVERIRARGHPRDSVYLALTDVAEQAPPAP
ncbi:MAG: PPOX class F420-dependent oxidoreductase [Angustibacter sp.]